MFNKLYNRNATFAHIKAMLQFNEISKANKTT